MGGHTIGVMHREDSGFDGEQGWVDEHFVFDNGFHKALIGRDGDLRQVCFVCNVEIKMLSIMILMQISHCFAQCLYCKPPGWSHGFVRNRGDLPDRWQWNAFPEGKPVAMVNSDVALVKELNDRNKNPRTGRVYCKFTDKRNEGNGCPRARDSIFRPMLYYSRNNRSFLRDFHSALVKMVNIGYSVDESTCDIHGVCQLKRNQAVQQQQEGSE